ncbi:MAG: T9SS type A sorting domain-containing protein [Flavobacteriia bacterium]|jgi:hypothetical protein
MNLKLGQKIKKDFTHCEFKQYVHVLFFVLIFFNNFGQTIYTTVGATTLTVPTGSTYAVVECLGAGGAGGGASGTAATTIGYAGGGGGGAYSRVQIAVTPGLPINVFVGAGGISAGLNAVDGGPGQQSYVSYNSNIVCSANGGLGGQASTSSSSIGGAGGNSGIGFLYRGGNGANGNIALNRGGGGGGAAGNTSNGGDAGVAPAAGVAGGGTFSSGAGGGGANTWNGGNGALYGAGGGGAGTGTNSSNGTGGAGAQGRVVITFCTNVFSTQPSTISQNLCVGAASTVLTASATSGPYLWYSNTNPSNVGGVSTGVTTSTFSPPTGTAGSLYYYCVAGSGACAIPSNVSGRINVGGSISSNVPPVICNGGSITLSSTAPGATSYSWSPGGATSSSITVSPTATTTYTLTTAGGSCPGTTSITVSSAPAISFSATVTSENLNGYTGFSGDILNLNAYPIQNNLVVCSFDNSLTGSLGGTWTNSVTNAGSTCGGQAAALSMVTTDTYLGPGGTGIGPQDGSHMLRFNSGFTDAGGLGYSTSPVFSTVGYTGIIVDFWFLQFVNSNGGEYLAVEYKVGAGAWTSFSPNYLRAGNSTQCPSWMNFSLEMPAAALGQASVQVRFKFYSGGCAGQQMLLDNVRISGVTVAGGYSFYSNYLWTETSTGVSANIVNPLIRSTTTSDVNNSSTPGSINFNVRLIDGNGCVFNASDVVNMNPSASGGSFGSANANPTLICSSPGSTALSFNPTGATPSSVQWQQSTVGATGPWTDIAGGTTINYNVSGITQTTWYRIKPITSFAMLSGSCSGSFNTTPVMVSLSTFTPGAVQSPGVTVCAGGDPLAFIMATLPVATGSTDFTYQWYSYDGTATAPTGTTAPVAGWSAVGSPGSGTPTPFTWSDNFDGGNQWTLSGNFSIGAPVSGNVVTTAYNVPNVLGTILNGNYAASCTEAVNNAVSPTINLTGVTSPVLRYYSYSRFLATCFLCSAGNDKGFVYVSIDNGVTWSSALETVAVNEGAYTLHTVNLPTAANQAQVKIKFTMSSDASNHSTGWNIDNLSVTGSIPSVPSYDPPATNIGSTTTTYAIFITPIGGSCAFSGWANLQYTVTVEPCILPIELSEFKAECKGGYTELQWSTASERDNDYFVVEGSVDGDLFSPVTQIDGAGNSSSLLNYSLMLSNKDFKYFRIRQVDFNGAFTFSNIIFADCFKNGASTIFFPNPFEQTINLDLSAFELENIRISIYDLNGKIVSYLNTETKIKSNILTMNLPDMKSGIYFFELLNTSNNEIISREKLIKM